MLPAALLAAAACPPASEAGVRAAFDAWLAAYRARDRSLDYPLRPAR